MTDLDYALRGAMLDADASAPVRPDLAEWLLATTPRTVAPRAPGARSPHPARSARWLLPALAAAAVIAIVVAGSLVWSNRSARHTPPVGPVSSVPTSALPANFSAHGIAFGDATHGVAIGDGSCAAGGLCPFLIRTADAGASWHGVPLPPHLASVSACDEAGTGSAGHPCVTEAAFADDLDGYLWGAGRLYQTSNGGRTWTVPASVTGRVGGVVIAGPNVYLDSGTGTGAGARVQLMRAGIGSTNWTPIGPRATVDEVQSHLAAGDGYVYYAAGGTLPSSGAIVVVGPGGRIGSGAGGDYCSATDGAATSVNDIAVAPDGAVVLSCSDTKLSWIRVSTDHARTFGPEGDVPNTIHGSGGSTTSVIAGICPFSAARIDAAGAPATAGPGASYSLTVDGGQHWSANGSTDSPQPTFVCRATGALTGYRIDPDRQGIQSTTDGSRSWRTLPIR